MKFHCPTSGYQCLEELAASIFWLFVNTIWSISQNMTTYISTIMKMSCITYTSRITINEYINNNHKNKITHFNTQSLIFSMLC